MKRNIAKLLTVIAVFGALTLGFVKPAGADRVGGPGFFDGTLDNYQSRSFGSSFRGREEAEITVTACHTDDHLRLYVYDENQRLVACDTDSDGIKVVDFVPSYTQRFTIKVVNREGYPVDFHIRTN